MKFVCVCHVSICSFVLRYIRIFCINFSKLVPMLNCVLGVIVLNSVC